MDNYLLISADSHAGPPTAQYREYLERKWHDEFDAYLDGRAAAREAFLARIGFKGKVSTDFRKSGLVRTGIAGAWDPEVRLKELDREGIVGEVLFLDGSADNEVPFSSMGGLFDDEHRVAGAVAHNRWVASLVADAPLRMKGIAFILPFDVDDAVREVHAAYEGGLRGGILVPTYERDLPLYDDPVYDPLWSTCEELDLPVHSHAGVDVGSGGVNGMEIGFLTHRILWQLVLSGVFDRFPGLKLVLTEQGADWVPSVLRRMDKVAGASAAMGAGSLSLTPWGVLGAQLPHRRVVHHPARAVAPRRHRRRHDHVGIRLPAP